MGQLVLRKDEHLFKSGLLVLRRSLLLLLFLLGGALPWCVGSFPTLALATEQPSGKVINAVGQAMVKGLNGITEISQGSSPVQLYEGDWVQTGVNSLVLLEVDSGVQVVMNESTEFLLISRWESEKGLTRILRLKQGEFWVILKGGQIRFEVETAVGTVAVDQTTSQDSVNRYLYGINPYGMSDTMPYRPPLEILPTEFDLVVSPKQTTTLTVLAGQVDFGTAFNTWAVPASTMSSASRGTRCSKPKEVEVQSVLSWAEKMRPLIEHSEGERSGH